MTKKIDYIKKAITKYLEPKLIEESFNRVYPKTFVRIRKDIIDTIEFQMSQYGNQAFYVHYYCALLPVEKEYYCYEIRYRIDCNDKDKIEWIGNNEKNAKSAILSVLDSLENIIMPWFDTIHTIEDFAKEDYILNARNRNKNITNFYNDWTFKILGKDKKNFLQNSKKYPTLNNDLIEIYTNEMLSLYNNKMSEGEINEKLNEISKKIELVRKDIKQSLNELFQETKDIPIDEKFVESLKNENIKVNNLIW